MYRTDKGIIETDWYQKPISSGRLLNYLSRHSTKMKLNIINNLIFRVFKLSNKKFHKFNEAKIKHILKANNYPVNLIQKCLSKYKFQNIHVRVCGTMEKDKTTYCKFPLIGKCENQLKSIFGNTNVSLAFYNQNNIGRLLYSSLKDKLKAKEVSNVVYKIPCYNCEKCYIGQTKQYVTNRINQHRYDCNITNSNKKDKTALAIHHFDQGHNFNFEDYSTLDSEPNLSKRKVSEIIYINLNRTVNFRIDTENLSQIYNPLIREIKLMN